MLHTLTLNQFRIYTFMLQKIFDFKCNEICETAAATMIKILESEKSKLEGKNDL